MHIARALGLRGVPQSPARIASISLALLLTAVEDFKSIRELDGMLIYSGGDDVYALSPVDTVVPMVYKLRMNFSAKGFKYLGSQPVASSIITGRSFSIRFVGLMDLMNYEAAKAFELMEEEAKKSKVKGDKDSIIVEKDSLVLSDSRTGFVAVIPLSLQEVPVHNAEGWRFIDILARGIYMLYLLQLFGVVSRNVPEDFREFVDDAWSTRYNEGLRRLTLYVLRRNIRGRYERLDNALRRVIDEVFNLIQGVGVAMRRTREDLPKASQEVEKPLILEILMADRVLRRYP